jgi:hypothetical protein
VLRLRGLFRAQQQPPQFFGVHPSTPFFDSSMKKYLLLLCPVILSNCGVVMDSIVDSALEREQHKDDVRAHLRHGDTIREAQEGAFEDQFYREMMWMN